MKAENLMAQPAPSPKSAGTSLRSAVKNQTAAQSAKADKNDFGSALDSAKNSQKDGTIETREAGKTNATDEKRPEAADANQKDTSAASETKNADPREAEAAEVDEKAAEAANELPKSRKKEKSSKSEADGNAETAEADSSVKDAATTLNAMLMAMAGNAQAGADQADALQPDEVQTDAALIEAMDVPVMEQQPVFASGALDSLLPQDAAKEQQAAQNQKLMDMLAGNGADMRLTDEQMKNLSSNAQELVATPGTEVVQRPGTEEAQILAQRQTTEPVVANGEAVMEQPETAAILQTEAAPVQTRTVAQENRTETRGEKPQSLFAGVPLTVEDAVLDKAQTGVRQDLGDLMERQPQQQTPEQTGETAAEALRTGGESAEPLRTAEQGESQTGAQQTQQPTGAGMIPQGMSFAETMNAAAPAEAAPVQQAQDPYNVMQQVVEQARLIRTDANTEMVIRLNPEHLGELTLRVAVTASGAVNATFHTENAQVRGLLESSMIQLKQELQQQGLKVNNVDVQSGLSEDFFAQSQAGQQGFQQPQQSARNQAADRQSFENDADALTVNPAAGGEVAAENPANVGEAEGVNYLV
ncbi:MAG: flagellar hook-length control protein FliK [Schwartzia sp.]|nr:flagellar hook-length control protein FliK [Schwartzia sp. (in: firmicutes)]